MRKTRIYTYIIAILIMPVPDIVRAQTGDIAMDFAALSSDPVEIGVGGVSSLKSLNGSSVRAGYMLYAPTDNPVTYMTLKSSYRLNENLSFFAEGLYGLCEIYEMFNQTGQSSGIYKPGQAKVQIGAQYGFTRFMRAKIDFKWLNESIAPDAKYSALAVDVIFSGDFEVSQKSDITIGAGISNLGTKVKSLSGASFSLPASANVYAEYCRRFGTDNIINILTELEYYLNGGPSIAAGTSYTYDDLITVRAGYRYGGKSIIPSYLSVGVGLKVLGVLFDFSYILGNDTMTNTLAVSIGYAF